MSKSQIQRIEKQSGYTLEEALKRIKELEAQQVNEYPHRGFCIDTKCQHLAHDYNGYHCLSSQECKVNKVISYLGRKNMIR